MESKWNQHIVSSIDKFVRCFPFDGFKRIESFRRNQIRLSLIDVIKELNVGS